MCRPCSCDENPVLAADLADVVERLEDQIRDLQDRLEVVEVS